MLETLDNLETRKVRREKINAVIAALNSNNTISHIKQLAVADPSIDGEEADVSILGKSTDGRLWVKIDTNDTDWEQFLITENGVFIADIKLPDSSGLVLDDKVLGQYYGRLAVGNGSVTNGNTLQFVDSDALESNHVPNGYIEITLYRALSTVFLSIDIQYDGTEGSAGICYSLNGGTPVFTAKAANSKQTLTINLGSSYRYRFSKLLLWPAANATSGKVGNITKLFIITSTTAYKAVINKCSELIEYQSSSSVMKYTNFSNMYNLKKITNTSSYTTCIDCSDQVLTDFIVPSNLYLKRLVLGDTIDMINFQMSGINDDGKSILSTPIILKGSALSTLLLKYTFVSVFELQDNRTVTSINISHNPLLTSITFANNTFDALNSTMILDYNGLTTDILYDLFDRLATDVGHPHSISVIGNPCESGGVLLDGDIHTAAETTALASSKGFTIILS